MGFVGGAAHLAKATLKGGVDRGLLLARRDAPGPYTRGVIPPPVTPDARAVLRRARVFFGHQSVGENILAGLRDLAAAAGEPAPRIVAVDGPAGLAALPEPLGLGSAATDAGLGEAAGFFAEAHLGANGDPAAKMADFARHLRGGLGDAVDVALMKFCYVDVDRRTRPAELFASYVATADDIATAYPRLTLLHATIPLTSGASLANALRGEYNSLLRSRYAAAAIVDIAALESAPLATGLTGVNSQTGRGHPGRGGAAGRLGRIGAAAALSRESLDPRFTTDGGHLNDAGRRRVAEGFVSRVAAAVAGRAA